MRSGTRVFAMSFVIAVMAACGTRQPSQEAPPPTKVALEDGECASLANGVNVAITSAIGEASSPVIAFDGELFRLAWWDMRGQYPAVSAVGVDRNGEKKTEVWTPSHEGASRDPSISVDSAEAHLVWTDDGKVESARIRDAGESPVKLSESATFASAGPRGAVAWVDKGVLFFRADGMLPPKDRKGQRPEPEPTILYQGGIEDPRVAWDGDRYAVVWSSSVPGGRRIMLQRVSNRGVRLGNPVVVSVTAGVSRNPEIAPMSGGFAVVWTNAAPEGENPRDRYRLFFAFVGEKGDAPISTRQLEFNGSADHVSVAAGSAECGIAWVGSIEPQGSAVFFARLDKSGKTLGETLHVSDGFPLTCGRPSVAFAGDGYGVAWHDDRDESGSKIMFSFLRCAAPSAENADAGAPDDKAIIVEAPPKAKEEPKLKKLFE